jgi:hypothetical protein
MTGIPLTQWPSHPHDPADFRRCEMLLRVVPSFRDRLAEMEAQSEVWATLVRNWDKIVAAMELEIPGIFDGRPVRGKANEGHALMKHLGC